MDAYSIHLAMAALVGASFVAVSAYYMHRKTLAQLLEFAKTIDRDREDFDDEALQHLKTVKKRNMYRKRGSNGHYRRASASFPDVREITNGGEANGGEVYVEGIPPGLPKLHTLSEGSSASISFRVLCIWLISTWLSDFDELVFD